MVFYKANGASSALIFIHGGAWIDERNTSDDFRELGDLMVCNCKGKLGYSLASVDYRLSPGVQHPVHLEDVVDNLYDLVQELGLDSIQLVGHSVGATLAWQVAVLDRSTLQYPGKLELVRSKLVGLFLVDGIYSLKELLNEYPSYDYFVSKAFKDYSSDFEEFDQSVDRIPSTVSSIHILHSYGDELLTLRQTNYMTSLLQRYMIPFTLHLSQMGLHEEVYRNAKLANYLLRNVVFH